MSFLKLVFIIIVELIHLHRANGRRPQIRLHERFGFNINAGVNIGIGSGCWGFRCPVPPPAPPQIIIIPGVPSPPIYVPGPPIFIPVPVPVTTTTTTTTTSTTTRRPTTRTTRRTTTRRPTTTTKRSKGRPTTPGPAPCCYVKGQYTCSYYACKNWP